MKWNGRGVVSEVLLLKNRGGGGKRFSNAQEGANKFLGSSD